MGTFQSLEDAKSYFLGDRFAMESGIEIESLGTDSCVCRMKLDARHRNAMGNVMGGAVFTLCDFAVAVISNHIHQSTVLMDADIRFLSAAKGDTLTAEARILKSGRTATVCQVIVRDSLSRDIALMTGTGCKLA